MELPINLVNAFKESRVVVFIGAGASVTVGLPSWNKLVTDLAIQLEIPPDAGPEEFSPSLLNKVPQYYENRFGRLELIRRLENLIKHHRIRNSRVHELIAELSCELFYTTNFDELLEEALDNQEIEFDKIASEGTARAFTERRRCQIRKIHGTISQPETLVITRLDYARINVERPLIIETLRNDLYSHVFLFIGYSLSDPDFNSIYDHVFNTMKTMTQRHFICTLSTSPHEKEDLTKRNLTSINIGSWPGKNPNEKLIAFLETLVETTSETIHIKRFFRIKKGQNLPIIVNSRMHEKYHYSFYPVCDIHVAQQLEKALNRIGGSSQIIPDKIAIEKPDDYLYSDLILICAPYSNQFTKYIYEKAEYDKISFDQCFVTSGSERSLEDNINEQSFKTDDPNIDTPGKIHKEFALIARYCNPWSAGRYIYVFSGVHALGTYAIGDFLENMDNFKKLPYNSKSSSAILELTYKKWDPNVCECEYKLKEIIPL